MQIFRRAILILLILHTSLAALIACTSYHKVLFQNEACIKPFHRYYYRTCEDMHALIDGDSYVIPKDFKTDLASIPRLLWPILAPQYAGFVAPAILHDYLYSCNHMVTRKFADEVLYSALLAEGVSNFTAIKFYVGVRLFGALHFKDHNDYCTRIVHEKNQITARTTSYDDYFRLGSPGWAPTYNLAYCKRAPM